MAKREYQAYVQLPRAQATHATQTARIQAASWPMAAKLALADVMKRPGVRRLRHRTVTLVLTVLDRVAGEAGEETGNKERKEEC